MDKDGGYNTQGLGKRPQAGFRPAREFDDEWAYYRHHILSIG